MPLYRRHKAARCGLSRPRDPATPQRAPMPTLFTKIIAGQIPAAFVFQDELWVGFLDIHPSSAGHALLVPVAEGGSVADLPAATLATLGDRLARLIRAVKTGTGCDDVHVVVNDGPAASQEVPHAHLHIIPRWTGDDRRPFAQKHVYAEGELAAMAARLAGAWK